MKKWSELNEEEQSQAKKLITLLVGVVAIALLYFVVKGLLS
jgi:hypothetical protein